MIRKRHFLDAQLLNELQAFFILLFPQYSITPGRCSLLLARVIGLSVSIVFIGWREIYIGFCEVPKKFELGLID